MVAQPVAEHRLDLFPRQRRFVLDPARFPAYVGGIGSGKTFAGAAKVVARLGRKELGLVFAPTFPMLRDATRRTLLALMTDLGIPFRLFKSDNVLVVRGSGHEIFFRSLEDPETARGPNADYAWIDEASLVSRLGFQIVKGRVRVGVLPQAWVTGTPKGRNWVWEEWERDADPDHPLYRVRTQENPVLPPGFAESLGYAGRFAEQELGGEFVAFEGLVYPSFSRPVHVRAVDCAGWRSVLGVDAGVRNPSAIATIRFSGDRRHQEREVYRPGMSSSELLAAVESEADATDAEAIHVDPSAAGLIADLERGGYPVRRATNNVSDGIRAVTTALADGMTVDPSCVHAIAEYEAYGYPEGGKADTDKPVKQNDHAMDATRYAVMGLAAPEPGVWLY